jgi:hypothetical protein
LNTWSPYVWALIVAGLSRKTIEVGSPVLTVFCSCPVETEVRDPAVAPTPIGVAPLTSLTPTVLSPESESMAMSKILDVVEVGVIVTSRPVMLEEKVTVAKLMDCVSVLVVDHAITSP